MVDLQIRDHVDCSAVFHPFADLMTSNARELSDRRGFAFDLLVSKMCEFHAFR